MTPKNVASSLAAVNPRSLRSESTLQLVPNWKAMMIPLTTPMAKCNANLSNQKSLPVAKVVH